MLLGSDPALELVGEAKNGVEAVSLVKSRKPDLILMDLSMPIMDGLIATRRIKKLSPRTKILVLTVHRSDKYILGAQRSGADGYMQKSATYRELMFAIANIFSGNNYLDPAVTPKPYDDGVKGRKSAKSHTSWGTLTSRELEVLKMIAEGGRSKEIALRLGISAKTVECHRANLMNKLNLHNVASLTAVAVEMGLLTN